MFRAVLTDFESQNVVRLISPSPLLIFADMPFGHNGNDRAPGYRDVCYGTTGHVEVVWLRYDPDVISYEELLEHFWSIHDPTTLDRQGPDVGSQYRSVIFYYDQKQQDAAILSKLGHQNRFIDTIVTEILPAGTFWKAEEYHQRYFEKNPGRGCHT